MNLTEFKILNTIRRLGNNAEKSALETHTKASYQTITNALTKGEVCERLQTANDKTSSLSSNYCHYLGVSVGTQNIKFIVLDYIFNPVFHEDWKDKFSTEKFYLKIEENGICFDTPKDSIVDFSKIINTVINMFLDEKDLKIKGIGIAFPGIVDNQCNKIVNCFNIPYLVGMTENSLFTPSLNDKLRSENIVVAFEHNSKAAIVAEKEKALDCLTSKKNVACLYLGTGIGAGYIFDNKLYRGQENSAGQIGHMKVMLSYDESKDEAKDNLCKCGQKNCIEQLIRNLITNKKGEIDITKLDDEKNLKRLSNYVAYLISNLLNFLSFDTIIITGRFSDCFDRMWPYISGFYADYCFGNLNSLCTITKSNLKLLAPAYGAAICSYFKEHDAEIQW